MVNKSLKDLLTNIIGSMIDIKVVKDITLSSSGSISANGATNVITTDVSSDIPSGYTLLFALFRGSAHNGAYCWYFNWSSVDSTVSYRLRNVTSSAITVSPTANLVCIKYG